MRNAEEKDVDQNAYFAAEKRVATKKPPANVG